MTNSPLSVPVGRLAPSPTGLLHIGNAWSFLLAWLAVRASDGHILLRQEDLDPARSRKEWMEQIEKDLHWLGLDWDEGPDIGGSHAPFLQSLRMDRYQNTLDILDQKRLIYPCYCTRKELRTLAGAPHGAADGLGDAGAAYPGTCRHLTQEQLHLREQEGRHAALRLLCPDGEQGRITFTDLVLGRQSMTLEECGGDFALRRSDGVWAYQLAVVADDIAMGITQVVRGEDLLFSTPRQIRLYQILGAKIPDFAHIPLICNAQGERLAKRHKSLSLAELQKRGCRPDCLIGWLAWKAGLQDSPAPQTPQKLAEHLRLCGGFPWHKLPKSPVILPDGMEQHWIR